MNKLDYLDFEQHIAELQEKIEELRRVGSSGAFNLSEEIVRLEEKKDVLTRHIFSNLSDYQIVQLARHPRRPYTWDYIQLMLTDCHELCGDRHSSAGSAIVGGLGRLNHETVMWIGHQKGRNTKEKLERNFGMPYPEEFRKALRLMKLAEHFHIPIITLIDTPGAYPGIEAEERNQSEAIGRNLFEMSRLKTPIVCVVIGEGCSGGALALGVGDCIMMLQYAYYSVISPEGCASILWKSADRFREAAHALNLTAERLLSFGLIDEIIQEPLGGAHNDVKLMSETLKTSIQNQLNALKKKKVEELLEDRYQKWLSYGHMDTMD